MARKVMTEKKKKKNIFKKIFLTLFIVALLVFIGLVIAGAFHKGPLKGWFKGKENVPIEIKVLDEVKDYGYKISDRDTAYYKEEFAKLKEIINEKEVDEKKYSEYVARMFVNDLYTMSTKVNKYDVGGIEYYHVDDLDDFTKSVMENIYKTMLDDTYGTREQKLPEVKSIETVSVNETTYKLGTNTVKAYEVKLKWTYVNDMGYDTQGTVIVVQQNGTEKWSVVDFQPKL